MPVPEEFKEGAKRVLVVEDDAAVAGVIKRSLSRAGFEVTVAEDGFKAGTLLGTLRPAVMTVDLRMRGVSGLDVVKLVRGSPRLAGVRVLVVSAMPREQLQEALDAGADDILEKPFEPEVLVKKVGKLAGL